MAARSEKMSSSEWAARLERELENAAREGGPFMGGTPWSQSAVRRCAFVGGRETNEPDIESVFDVLASNNMRDVMDACYCFRWLRIGQRDDVDLCVAAYQHTRPRHREQFIRRALDRTSPARESTKRILLMGLRSRSRSQRMSAAYVVAAMRERSLLDDLRAASKREPDKTVRNEMRVCEAVVRDGYCLSGKVVRGFRELRLTYFAYQADHRLSTRVPAFAIEKYGEAEVVRRSTLACFEVASACPGEHFEWLQQLEEELKRRTAKHRRPRTKGSSARR